MFVVCSELCKSHGKSKKLKASVTALAVVALMGIAGNAVAVKVETSGRIMISKNEEYKVQNKKYEKQTTTVSSAVFSNEGTLTLDHITFGGENNLGNTAALGGLSLTGRDQNYTFPIQSSLIIQPMEQ